MGVVESLLLAVVTVFLGGFLTWGFTVFRGLFHRLTECETARSKFEERSQRQEDEIEALNQRIESMKVEIDRLKFLIDPRLGRE